MIASKELRHQFLGSTGFRENWWPLTKSGDIVNMVKVANVHIYINIYTIHWYFDDSPTFSEAKIPWSYLHVFLCTQKKCLRKVGRHIFSLHSGRGPVGWVHQEDQGWSNGWWVSDCFGRSLPWVGKLTVNLPKTNSLGCTWKNGWKLGNCILSLFGGLPNFRYLC